MPASEVQGLSLLIKGFFVTASPILGWGILKIILLVFTYPQYFFLIWFGTLGIGLLAEFFTETWRPSVRLSRTTQPTSTRQPESVNTAQLPPYGAQMSPMDLFKSLSPGEDDHDRNHNDALSKSVVKVDAKLKTRSKIRSPSIAQDKGFGKPVLLRVDNPTNSTVTKSPRGKESNDNDIHVSSSIDEADLQLAANLLAKLVEQTKQVTEPTKSKKKQQRNQVRDKNDNNGVLLIRTELKSKLPNQNGNDDDSSYEVTSDESTEFSIMSASKEWGLLMYDKDIGKAEKFRMELSNHYGIQDDCQVD